MENASKALIMAGGMLLAILIISLLIYAWSLFSEYQASKDSLADIEDTAKFNEQFSNYDRDDVQGYELISLVNMIADYNYRKSSDAGANSNDKYSPITITISFVGDKTTGPKNRSYLCPKGEANILFINDEYAQPGQLGKPSFKENIIDTITNLENDWGGTDNATKIAKGYEAIFVNPKSEEDKTNAVKKFNYLSSNNPGYSVTGYAQMTSEQKDNAFKCYEYMQFKRSVFKSASNSIKYDDATGRITNMAFNFVEVR